MPDSDVENKQSPTPAPNLDSDGQAFREQSLARVQADLNEQLPTINRILKTRNPQQIRDSMITSADNINRSVLGLTQTESGDITSYTAFIDMFGISVWIQPANVRELESDLLGELATKLARGEIDNQRFAKGVYFLQILLHKYENGNGRTGRAIKLLIDSAERDKLTEEDTRDVLGIKPLEFGKTFKLFKPDLERTTLGVAYFAADKGLSQDEIINKLGLNGKPAEQGLDVLAKRLGVSKNQLKNDYIRFMAVQSTLDWCDFGDR